MTLKVLKTSNDRQEYVSLHAERVMKNKLESRAKGETGRTL